MLSKEKGRQGPMNYSWIWQGNDQWWLWRKQFHWSSDGEILIGTKEGDVAISNTECFPEELGCKEKLENSVR